MLGTGHLPLGKTRQELYGESLSTVTNLYCSRCCWRCPSAGNPKEKPGEGQPEKREAPPSNPDAPKK